MTIVGRRVLERYVRDLFNAPLAFPRGGKFVGAFATFSSMLGFSVQRRKEMLPTPTHFYFSGLTARFDGYFSHVCFPCFRVFSSGFAAKSRPWSRAQRPSRASADAAKDAEVLKSSFLVLGDTKYSPECIMAWK